MANKIILPLFFFLFFSACQEKPFLDNLKNENESTQLIGQCHNEILKNFIMYSNQDSRNLNSNPNDFVKIMANYGVSILTTFKNDPPAGDLNTWVEGVLNESLDQTQARMVNLVNNGTTMVNAINVIFGRGKISSFVESYLIELNSIVNQYSGSSSFQNQVDLLHLKYYRSASQDDKTIISWTTDLAKGSHDYWKQEHSKWAPTLYGGFWDFGKKILIADAVGGLEYILSTKIGLIAGPISWKIGAAYAALNSILSGTTLLLEGNARSGNFNNSIGNITSEEILDAYLKRKNELGLD